MGAIAQTSADSETAASRPKSAYAEGRVGFLAVLEEREYLVGTGVKRTYHHPTPAEL
jgi:hypothetical protein